MYHTRGESPVICSASDLFWKSLLLFKLERLCVTRALSAAAPNGLVQEMCAPAAGVLRGCRVSSEHGSGDVHLGITV